MIGVRLKLARRATGLSLRGLSAAINHRVTAQAIGKYERNESMPSSGVLISLARVLGTSMEYLLGDPDLILQELEFRKNAFTTKHDEAQVEATVLVSLERYLAIEDILAISTEWDQPENAPYPVKHSPIEAELAANTLRQYWGLGQEPIPNLVELLEERGMKIFSLPLGNIGGLAARVHRSKRSSLPLVVVNSGDWGERQRFTIAHELGHVLLNIESKLPVESIAHRFASAFLIPSDTLRLEVGKHRTSIPLGELLFLKQIFGVSIQALTYRCKDLGIISKATYAAMFNEFEHLGWRTPPYEEIGAYRGEEPTRFRRLCLRALAEGAITESKAAELLEIPVNLVESFMCGTPHKLVPVERTDA